MARLNKFSNVYRKLWELVLFVEYVTQRAFRKHFADCVFIGGIPHSGTSIITRIIGSHDDVYVPTDEMYIPARPGIQSQIIFWRLYKKKTNQGKRLLIEKTPRNALHLDELRRLAPESKFVLIVRDYRDVIASQKRRAERDFLFYVENWICYANKILEERHKEDVLLIRYEDFIDSPNSVVERVCNFAGISFYSYMLNFHNNPVKWFNQAEIRRGSGIGIDEHRALRNWQINQPLFDGRGRWRDELSAEELNLLTERGLDQVAKLFGY